MSSNLSAIPQASPKIDAAMSPDNEVSQLVQNPIEYLQQHPNDFVERVKGLVFSGDDETGQVVLPEIPNLAANQDIVSLHQKLVRFDCMVSDQHDDEFYYPRLEVDGRVVEYRYFQDIGDKPCKEVNGVELSERGNLKAVSVPNLAPWLDMASRQEVHLKTYYDDMTAFKLNQILRVVGVLELVEAQAGQGTGLEAELLGQTAQPARLELHVVVAKPLTSIDLLQAKVNAIGFDPLWWRQLLDQSDLAPQREMLAQSAEKLTAILKLILHGDELAAKFVCYALTAHCYNRPADLNPLGNFPVNVSNVTAGARDALMNFLSQILPSFLPIKVTTQTLTEMRLTPKKNYETNALIPSVLQLPADMKTHVVFDELDLQSGQISGEEGIKNVRAIAELIEQQTVAYDFQYCQPQFVAQAPILLLSDCRSMFKNTTHVKVQRTAEPDIAKVAEVLADAEMMNELRSYLLAMQMVEGSELLVAKAYTVEDECMEHVTTFFSEERKRLGTEKVDQITLHNWLSLARMVTLSQGKTALTAEYFKEAVRLDQERAERL